MAAYEPALMPSVVANCSWTAIASALIAWYSCACAANWEAVSRDTKSAAAGTTPVVGPATAAFPARATALIDCSSPAVAASISGSACMIDMVFSSL
ncbi:hypothetical protein IQ40_18245 [Mycobacterium tuberculosis]|nr:hypothetical protein IQ40_18245 [Mycobacterium tuberculosis]